MKKRYCETDGHTCSVAWCSMSSDGSRLSCYDEPKEKNCHHLIDEDREIEVCPTCGTALGFKERLDYSLKEHSKIWSELAKK